MADATYTAVDLSRLPPPDIVERLDFDTIYADAVARMQSHMPEFQPRESDPATKQLLVLSYFAQILRQRVNDAARAVMPAYSTGADLDNLAALVGVTRFTLTPADPQTGTAAVMESDTDLRRRMVLAPEGYSVAGPEGAYIFHALSADPAVLDASASSPAPDDIKALVLATLADHDAAPALRTAVTQALADAIWPGQVVLSILSRAGDGAASDQLVATVQDYVSADTMRPLTDYVTARSADIVEYAVDAQLAIFNGPDAQIVLDAATASIGAYTTACHRLGRMPTLSGLYAALHVEGVEKVTLLAPLADIAVSRQQAAYCTAITITRAVAD